MKDKKIFIGLIYYLILVYLELVFRIVCTEKILPLTIIHTLLYLLPITFLLTTITSLFKEKINSVISKILIFILTFWYAIALVFKQKLGVYFSIASMGLADQLKSFIGDTLATIGNNIIYILILFIPFILVIIFRKRISSPRLKPKWLFAFIGGIALSYLMFFGSLFINKDGADSVYNLVYKVENHSLTVEKIGVMPSTMVEVRRLIFGFEEDISELIYIPPVEEKPSDLPEEIKYNVLDIDFDTLNANTSDKTLLTMNQYFAADPGTKQNEYTGLYEGKNLILFMAESFNSVAVSPELTPTLYKLANESFVFENFYSPVILSTIGGEFQELTGLYAHYNALPRWRGGNNSFPMGLGNVFNSMGYNTFAYHNNQFNFQARDKYLKAIGFNNYLGCWNGLEESINCHQWPESDVEMIEATVADYVNSEQPFMTYYATVSGHMSYSWGNAMSKKHREKVEAVLTDPGIDDEVKAYVATQVELDLALQTLIEKLEAAGVLQDTVIALVADHYPYDLELEQINQISTYERDGKIEINHSHFILWNSETETTKITKIGSQIDVLPTLYNLFGVEYDSRLIIGNDILSDTEGLAMFDNQSWVSDYGKYYAATGKFVPFEGVIVSEDYVETMKKKVQSKVTMSRYILEKDYYKYVFSQ